MNEPLSPRFERRVVIVAPGEVRAYEPAEWRDALVVIERGAIEVETVSGHRHSFDSGEIIWLTGLPLHALLNSGPEPAVLVALSRRDPD